MAKSLAEKLYPSLDSPKEHRKYLKRLRHEYISYLVAINILLASVIFNADDRYLYTEMVVLVLATLFFLSQAAHLVSHQASIVGQWEQLQQTIKEQPTSTFQEKDRYRFIEFQMGNMVRLYRLIFMHYFSHSVVRNEVDENNYGPIFDKIESIVLWHARQIISPNSQSSLSDFLTQDAIMARELLELLQKTFGTVESLQLHLVFAELIGLFPKKHMLAEVAFPGLAHVDYTAEQAVAAIRNDWHLLPMSGMTSLVTEFPRHSPDKILEKFNASFVEQFAGKRILVLGDAASGIPDAALVVAQLKSLGIETSFHTFRHSTDKERDVGPAFTPSSHSVLSSEPFQFDAIMIATEFTHSGEAIFNTAKSLLRQHPKIPVYAFASTGGSRRLMANERVDHIVLALNNNIDREIVTPEQYSSSDWGGAAFFKIIL